MIVPDDEARYEAQERLIDAEETLMTAYLGLLPISAWTEAVRAYLCVLSIAAQDAWWTAFLHGPTHPAWGPQYDETGQVPV